MRSWLYSPQKLQCLSWCHWLVCRFSQGWCQRWSGRSSRSLKRGGRRWSFTQAPRCAWAPGGSWRRPRDWWVPDVLGPSFPCRNWCGGRALPAPTGAGSAADMPAMAPAVRDGDVCWRPDLLVAAMSSFPAETASNLRFFISFLVPWADKWSPSTRNRDRPLSISPLWYVKLLQLSTYVQSLLCAKPNKQHDGNCDGLIRPSCESRTKKYTKFKNKTNKTNKTKYNKQASKQ